MQQVHSLLKRQIEKYFGDLESMPQEFEAFLQAVNTAYFEADMDKRLLERSIELSSEELLKTNSEMRAVLQSFPDLILWLSSNGKILDVKGGAGMDGVINRKDIGRTLGNIFPKEISHKLVDALYSSDKNKNIEIVQYMQKRGGRHAHYEARFFPFTKNQIVAIIRNITQEKRNIELLQEKVRLQTEIKERQRTEKIQSVLYAISQATNTTHNLKDLLQVIHRQLSLLMDTTNFFVALYDKTSDSYTFPYFVDQYDKIGSFTKFQLKKSLTDYVRRTGRPILVDEKINEELIKQGEIELVGTPSPIWLGVPLMTKHGVIGVVVVQSYTDANLYSENELELLKFVSDNIALAIERKTSEDKIKVLAKFPTENPSPVLRVDNHGVILYANAASQPILKKWRRSVHDKVPKTVKRLIKEALQQGKPKEEILCGHQCFSLNIAPIVESNYVYIYAFDVTEKRKTQQALEESEKLYRKAIEVAGAVPYYQNYLKDEYVFMGDGIADLTGYTSEQFTPGLLREILQEIVLRGDLAGIPPQEAAQKARSEEGISWRADLRIYDRNGQERWLANSAVQVRDEGGKVIGSLGILQDITQRKKTEKQLEIQRDLKGLLATISTNFINISSDKIAGGIEDAFARIGEFVNIDRGLILEFPEAAERVQIIHEWCAPGVASIKKKASSLELPEKSTLKKMFNDSMTFVIQDVQEISKEFSLPHKLLKTFNVKSAAFFPMLKAERFKGVIVFHAVREKIHFTDEMLDMLKVAAEIIFNAIQRKRYEEERKRSETKFRELYEVVRESEEKYRTFFETSRDAVYISTPRGKFIDINPAGVEIFGYDSRDELLKIDIVRDLGMDPKTRKQFKELIAKQGYVKDFKWVLSKKNGDELILLESGSAVYDNQGKIVAYRGIIRDVTEQYRAEERIRASLKEKEVLLKEIHHRVKNNMQIISSLLNLQAQYIKDPHDLELFKESQNRVKSMALIHERLYKSKDLAQINLLDYVQSLTKHLFSMYRERALNVHSNIQVENVSLGMDQAIPCGLIINELVSNSLKYGFPDRREGEVQIKLLANGNGKISLIVKDNGIGLPGNFSHKKSKSLGLQLVYALTEQLQGSLQLQRNGGTTFQIEFPKHDVERN